MNEKERTLTDAIVKIITHSKSDWEKKFARSLLRQLSKGNGLSGKQASVLKRLDSSYSEVRKVNPKGFVPQVKKRSKPIISEKVITKYSELPERTFKNRNG